MLYPDFNELVAFKDRKTNLKQLSKKSVHFIVPGNHHSPFRGQGLEFDSVREYVPGDDIRNIDWRVTARTGSPHLKLFKQERERHIAICIDVNASMRFGTRNTFKSVQAARVASLIGWKSISQHDKLSACLFGDVLHGIRFFPPSKTKKSFCGLLKTLSEPPMESHEISLKEILRPVCQAVHTGTLIYLISDFLNIEENHPYEADLQKLNKKGDVIFISINDAADKSIQPVGYLKFKGNHGPGIYVDTDQSAGFKKYEHQWNENRQKLYELTSCCKIPLLELTTESDIRREFVKMFAKRKLK